MKSRTTALDFRRAEFDTLGGLLRRIPWVMVLDRGGVQDSCLQKSSKGSRRTKY